MKAVVKDIPVDGDLKLDVPAMTAAATGAGLVFFCNPNNPTGTVHSRATVTKFVEDVLAACLDLASPGIRRVGGERHAR